MASIDHGPGPPHDKHRRIDDIEVLRAFAVGLVMVEHVRLNLLPWVGGEDGPLYGNFNFWSGVDLFLAISGFVIARSLLPMLSTTRNTAEFFNTTLSFWVRRAWRLLPSAWLWLGVILIATLVFNRSGAFTTFQANFEGALAGVLNVANFRNAAFFGKTALGAASPYWSLSLEEQFYVVLPFLVFFTRKQLPIALAVIVLAQLFINRHGPGGSVLMNMTKSDALSLGVLLALWSHHPSYHRLQPTALKRLPIRLLLPPVFLVAFAALSGPAFGPKHHVDSLIAVLSAAIVWLASYNGDYLFPPGRLKRVLCWIGARSYAAYVIHLPAFFATREFWFRVNPEILTPSLAHAWVLLLSGFGLLVALAELNYRFVEVPLRKRGARIAERIRQRDVTTLAGLAEPRHA